MSTTPSVTIFSRVGKKIIKRDLGKNLSRESIILYFFILYQGRIIIVVKQARYGVGRLIIRIFKIFEIIIIYVGSLI